MIKKLPDGRWESRTDTYDAATGKRRQLRRRFPTKAAAQEYERSLLLLGPAAPARRVPTFDAYAQSWVASREASGNLSNSTIVAYRSRITKLRPVLGSVLISKLTPARLEGAVAELRKTITPSSIKVCLSVIRSICKRAIRDGYLSANPVPRIEPLRVTRKEIDPPDAGELRRILASVEGTPAHLPMLLMAMTGMRIGEVLGLLWDSVDTEHGMLTVRRQRVQRAQSPDTTPVPGTATVLLEHTKTRQIRTIAIPDALVAALKAARRDQLASGHPSRFVCTDAAGIPISRVYLFGLLPNGVRLHDIRHAHATLLIDAGVPLPEVSRRLGHSSTVTTASIYIHAIESQDRAASNAISNVLDDTKVDTTGTPSDTSTHL